MRTEFNNQNLYQVVFISSVKMSSLDYILRAILVIGAIYQYNFIWLLEHQIKSFSPTSCKTNRISFKWSRKTKNVCYHLHTQKNGLCVTPKKYHS